MRGARANAGPGRRPPMPSGAALTSNSVARFHAGTDEWSCQGRAVPTLGCVTRRPPGAPDVTHGEPSMSTCPSTGVSNVLALSQGCSLWDSNRSVASSASRHWRWQWHRPRHARSRRSASDQGVSCISGDERIIGIRESVGRRRCRSLISVPNTSLANLRDTNNSRSWRSGISSKINTAAPGYRRRPR